MKCINKKATFVLNFSAKENSFSILETFMTMIMNFDLELSISEYFDLILDPCYPFLYTRVPWVCLFLDE